MAIEVRQMVVRCSIVLPPPAPAQAAVREPELQALREQLLAECRALLREGLQRAGER
jgi:hypothetical protein